MFKTRFFSDKKLRHLLKAGILLGGLETGLETVNAQDVGSYTLALGDVISIHVFDEADLSFEKLLITDTGMLRFPFLGEIQATGKTVSDVQQAIVDGLRPDYLVDPKVTVSIVEYRPFFLTGQVSRPGSIPYQPGLTLRQAMTLAGGMTERASTSRITVISDGDKSEGNDDSRGEERRIDLDYQVKPGDTITIGESFF